MGIGVSVFLIAAGAILTWAVSAEVQGVDLQVVGVILMVVGIIGLVWSLIVFGGRDRTTTVREAPARDRVVERRVEEF
jgi:hypothetical protein